MNAFLGTSISYNLPIGRGGAAYGDDKISLLRGGSGGGGGGATAVRLSATNFQSRLGGGGGGGGGAFELVARGQIRVSGEVICDGGDGAQGNVGNQAGAGGGGAGGAIALHATGDLALISSTSGGNLSAQGGFGGLQSPSQTNPPARGRRRCRAHPPRVKRKSSRAECRECRPESPAAGCSRIFDRDCPRNDRGRERSRRRVRGDATRRSRRVHDRDGHRR